MVYYCERKKKSRLYGIENVELMQKELKHKRLKMERSKLGKKKMVPKV